MISLHFATGLSFIVRCSVAQQQEHIHSIPHLNSYIHQTHSIQTKIIRPVCALDRIRPTRKKSFLK